MLVKSTPDVGPKGSKKLYDPQVKKMPTPEFEQHKLVLVVK